MVIIQEETYKRFGYYSTDLSPQSHKPILAACDKCGGIRETSKHAYRALCPSCSQKAKHLSEQTRKRIGDAQRGKHLSECTRKKMMESQKGEKHHMFGKHLSEEAKRKLSEANKGTHHTEETKRKLSESRKGKYVGESNSNWKNGASFEPYCCKFNEEFKQYIRAKFGNVCFLCGKTEEWNGRKLSVHHVNYNKTCGCAETEEAKKADDGTCQFVPLCISCNSKVNKDRDMWERKIKNTLRNKLNGWYI